MSVGMLILALWLTVAAAYLIWQFATGSLAGEEQMERRLRGETSTAASRPREARPAVRQAQRPISVPVIARAQLAGLHAHRPRRTV